MRFNIEELEEKRDLRQVELEWLDRNVPEIEQLSKVLKDKDKVTRAVCRILDFVGIYPDLDPAGDWALVRQIVLNEILLDELHVTLSVEAQDGFEDIKLLAESTRLVNNLQSAIDKMTKTLGTNRGTRRKDTRESIRLGINLEELKALKSRVSKGRESIVDVEARVIEADRALTNGH